jgi:environmental stress-induced protein Ves
MTRIAAPLLIILALVVAGCGGSGTASGTVNTSPATTAASGSASFDVNFKSARQRLTHALKQVESGDAAKSLVGAGTVLTTCSDTVTKQLGARASSSTQQQSVSALRTACTDASEAVAKLKKGDTAAASRLAQTALQEVEQAGK